MATLTITLDPEVLKSAQIEAERRHITVEEFAAETISTSTPPRHRPFDNSRLGSLMKQGILGDLGPLPTRDEIYAERTKWPRS
jgi:hypothetical protein